jgi:hypothetical protein
MTESTFTNSVCKDLEQCGAVVIPYVGNFRQQNGVPDRFVAHNLWCGWLEFKTARGRLSTAQKIFIGRLNVARKNTAFVIREPNIVEDRDGKVLLTFKGGFDLLLKLYHIKEGAV